MTEDDCSRVSMPESTPATDSSITKQRKKRKWDQPAESLVSAGIAVPGFVPMGPTGAFIGSTHPGVATALINPLTGSYGHLPQALLAPLMQQHASALAQKIQPKIQEDLIAREIVINDAESSVRYKLTKRHTQEEIQKCTGAIVITRGKYRPPNAPSDGEKPLYLHISAGTHLETTADSIKAVDQAAIMVEEILKQGNGLKLFSTCVFLGFEPDPSLNITARIRGPNDQYVNHIMNETGSTVILRGRGSGNPAISNPQEQQGLHLFLSSSNSKSLEHAKLLGENLLDTICAECGASRVSSIKVYGAVPPPAAADSLSGESSVKISANSASSSTVGCSLGVSYNPQIQSSLSDGTRYNGYGGIYPEATPLQQVALALKQSNSNSNSATQTTTSTTVDEKGKRPPPKRKFQELPARTQHQGSTILKPSEAKSSNGMMPPPPRIMAPPTPVKNTISKPKTEQVPDTLISLMEYGDEDEESVTGNSKPFWAV